MEHSTSVSDRKSGLRYMQAADLPTIVRVPSKAYHHIARACDMGAEGVMLPMVGSADEAKKILESMKYYPEGGRGVALQVAHDDYRPGPVPQKLAAANKRTTFFAQIETAEGVKNADAIAAVDGVDCLWVGHFDLSVSLGIPGEFDNPKFTKAIDRVVAATRKHGKALGRLAPSVEQGLALYRGGFDFLCYSGDVWLLQSALTEAVGRLQAGAVSRGQVVQAAMAKFRVALSGDFVKADGSPAIPMFDLEPLRNEPNVKVDYVAPVDGVMPAAGLAGHDALILLTPKFDKSSVPADGRLAIVARFGVGYDSVNVEACTAAHRAGVTPRRPAPCGRRRSDLYGARRKMMIKDKLTRGGPSGSRRRRTWGRPRRPDTGLCRHRQYRRRDVPPVQTPRRKFIAHDPFADRKVADSLGVRLVDLETVFRESDFVTVNCPLMPETTHLVNAARLALMKPTAYFINTARGPIVDQKALTKALQERRIAGAGLDVFDPEPPPADDPILKLDNVILAPHALCWTDQCFAGIGASDVKAVLDVMHGRDPVGIVNRAVLSAPAWRKRLDEYRADFG